jgi:hypothetical protein
MSATITYKGKPLETINGGEYVKLNTKGKTLEGDIRVEVARGSGANGAIDLSNIPEVESLEVTDTSHTAVRYNSNIYLLMEGEING